MKRRNIIESKRNGVAGFSNHVDAASVRAQLEREEAEARMAAAYRGDGMSFEDDGSPEHDD